MNPHASTARLECVRDLINAARSNKFSTLRKLSADGQGMIIFNLGLTL